LQVSVGGEHSRETREAVLVKVGLTHTILYDIYDLCTFAREAKLPTFKVKMLREICTHFDLPFQSRDTKAVVTPKSNDSQRRCYLKIV